MGPPEWRDLRQELRLAVEPGVACPRCLVFQKMMMANLQGFWLKRLLQTMLGLQNRPYSLLSKFELGGFFNSAVIEELFYNWQRAWHQVPERRSDHKLPNDCLNIVRRQVRKAFQSDDHSVRVVSQNGLDLAQNSKIPGRTLPGNRLRFGFFDALH